MLDPLQQPCGHAPTPEEQNRDRDYLGCMVAIGQPCLWAKRFDGVPDPAFHSERWELAAQPAGLPATCANIDAVILADGEV